MIRSVKPWMVFVFGLLAFVFSANAQYPQQQNWGTGMYPAQPACGYQNSIADGATSIRDELNQRTRELQQAKSDQRRLRSRQSSLRAGANAQRDLFKMTGFDGPVFNQIETHVNSGSSCNQYRGYCSYRRGGYAENDATPGKDSRMPAADLGGYEPPPDDGDQQIPETEPPAPNPPSNNGRYRPPPQRQCQDGNVEINGGLSPAVFMANCGPAPGEMGPGVCDQIVEGSMPRGRSASACRKYLRAWMDKERELRGMDQEIAELDAKILELEALTKASKVELAEAMREREEALRNGTTQAGCVECALASNGGGGGFYQQPQRSGLWDLAGGIIAAGVQAYSSYSLGKYVANQNAKLGFQTQQIPLAGQIMSAGWPMISSGLYGVLGGGGGQGSFGCGGGPFGGGMQFGQQGFAGANGFMGPYGVNGAMGANAMFGFPQSMYGTPAGGGMFNVGMGAGFQPGYGAQAYCPVQPCPIQGYAGMGGFPGVGGQVGFGVGGGYPGMGGYNPFQPGMGTNLGFSAGIGAGMPYGYGGVGGYNGIPGYGGVGVGYGGIPGQYGGVYGAGGMPYGGMPGIPGYGASAGVWAGTPQPYGGVGGVYGAPGMPYGYGGLGTGGMQYNNYQYQQQMYQAQAQQYALMAQQQQAAYQAQLAQQQTLSNLYGEMYSLNARIQSAQSQMSSGGYLGMPGYSGYGYGAGVGIGVGAGYNFGTGAMTPQPFPYNQPVGVQPIGTTPAFSR